MIQNLTDIEIAASVVSMLVNLPYNFAEGVGKGFTGGIGKDLWELLRKKFSRKKERETLKSLAESPDNNELQEKVKFILECLIAEDNELRKELQTRIETYIPTNEINTQTITGNQNVTLQNIQKSNININKNPNNYE